MAHLAEVGYQPEFGARELKRRIRAEVETRLADALLKGEFSDGDGVRAAYSSEERSVILSRVAAPETTASPRGETAPPRKPARGKPGGRAPRPSLDA